MTSKSIIALICSLLLLVGAGVTLLLLRSGSVQDRNVAAASYVAAFPVEASPSGVVREFDLVAAPSTVSSFDGRLVDVWAYNGSVPAAEIRVNLGETLIVNFENQLPQPSSIHWHGVRVPNRMDGVPGVNQDPVEPGGSFRYEFTPKDAGTFWFHSHNRSSEQVERGLYGSLVVIDPTEPVYDRDIVWVIDDVLLDDDGAIAEGFNGNHETSHNGRWGNVMSTNGRINPIIDLQPGERVRLRLINASNARVIAPEFGDLAPVVIAVDGTLVRRPFPGQGFVLAPGNRVDLDVTLPNTEEMIVVDENFNGEGFDIATLRISGSTVDTPTFAPPTNEAVPESGGAQEFNIDHEYSLDFFDQPMEPQWGFNGRTFADTETLSVDAGELLVIRLTNDSQALHPIHFHGQFFQVVSQDGDPVDEGHFRDTVLVLPGQVVDVVMAPVDVGTWAVHCHILEHADAGMMTLLRVGV